MRAGLTTEAPQCIVAPAAPAARVRGSLLWLWSALGAIFLASTGHLLIKLGLTIAAGHASASILPRIGHYLTQPWVVFGLGVYAMGTALWIYAVSQRHISFLYPLTALNYALVALGGKLLFAERVSAGRCLGIGVVVLGVAMLQLSQAGANK